MYDRQTTPRYQEIAYNYKGKETDQFKVYLEMTVYCLCVVCC